MKKFISAAGAVLFFAGMTTWGAGEPPALLDRAAALEAAARVDSGKYPDAEEVLVAGLQKIAY